MLKSMDIELFKQALKCVMEARKPEALNEVSLRAVMDEKYPGASEPLLYKRKKDWCRFIKAEIGNCSVRSVENTFDLGMINQFRRHLYLEHLIHGQWTVRSLQVMDRLGQYLCADDRFPLKEETLIFLFDLGVDLWLIEPNDKLDLYFLRSLSPLVDGAKRIQSALQCTLSIEVGRMEITDEFLKASHDWMEQRVIRLGGLAVLRHLFKTSLSKVYDPVTGRYEIYRYKPDMIQKYQGQGFPYRYLIQLAVKHLCPGSVIKPQFQEEEYQNLLRFSADFLEVLDVCNPSFLSDFYQPTENFPNYITDNAIYEACRIPAQYSPDFCELLLERLYLPLLRSKRVRRPALAKSLLAILKCCAKMAPCTFLTAEELRAQTSLGADQISEALRLLSIPSNEVNQDFYSLLTPTNQAQYPFIRCPGGRFFFLCRELSCYAFCERAVSVLGGKISALNRELGVKLEELVRSLLREKGFSPMDGTFKAGKCVIGQCDVFLERKNEILLIEVKKRSLPDSFSQADIFSTYRSLSEGMVYGQIQLLKIRERLEQDGKLDVYKNAADQLPHMTLHRLGRQILTVSLCLPEYAFLSNATVARGLMRSLLHGRLESRVPGRDGDLEKINQLADSFRSLMQDHSDEPFHQYIHYCCFRSLQQFWLALHTSESLDEFFHLLTKDCSIATSAMDYYALFKLGR